MNMYNFFVFELLKSAEFVKCKQISSEKINGGNSILVMTYLDKTMGKFLHKQLQTVYISQIRVSYCFLSVIFMCKLVYIHI